MRSAGAGTAAGRKKRQFPADYGLWILYRLGALSDRFSSAAASATDTLHSRSRDADAVRETLRGDRRIESLRQRPKRCRCAGPSMRRDALGLHADPANVPSLLRCPTRAQIAPDSHLVYVMRMALRNQLSASDAYAKLDSGEALDADSPRDRGCVVRRHDTGGRFVSSCAISLAAARATCPRAASRGPLQARPWTPMPLRRGAKRFA
jgi:hypothetical protein